MSRARAGLVVVAVYLGVAAATFTLADLPVRPLFDGVHTQQPYRWVDPPPEEADFNQPPQPGSGEVELTGRGSRNADFRTGDLQAGAVFPQGAFDATRGERRIVVTITPLDPTSLADAPGGLEFQGNAYRIEARYRRSGRNAPTSAEDCADLTAADYRCFTVLLRTPFGATEVARLDRDAWRPLPEDQEAQNDIFADSAELGTFVALAPEGTLAAAFAARTQVPRAGAPLRDVIAIILGVIVTVAGAGLYRRRLTGQRREEVRKRAAGRKYRPPEKKRALKR